ncbi:ABC transporter permease [uncultured Jannaschia sp.]|uniref:ABC transporter permease n=1 Tax=uncultured Jannaschia sp. TaxID=293347 RepID=UPI00261181E0|nr:ABC transporter permease [uncultured Jannaschia sp.]
MNNALMRLMQKNRWSWSAAGVIVLWIILSIVTGRWSIASLSGILVSASFLTLAGLGQMIVVSTGRGNIDLSIASVITLSAYVALLVIKGQDALIWLGLLATLGIGLGVGLCNAMLVIILRVPAIIATLATGYILATAALIANSSLNGSAISPTLRWIASGRVGGVPIMVMIAISTVILAALLLHFTAYGRKLSAVGQNRVAARLAGVRVNRVLIGAFLTSSCLAAFNGLLLGAYVGGAFLEMGQPYLLQSVAAVVIGGTLIFGGSSTALGTFFASILLILVVTIMQIMGLPRGVQDMVQGVVVIVILGFAAGGELRRSRGRVSAKSLPNRI